jgi:nucleotidyltransferase substrate binding protein (TIGR01987 family)
LVKRGAKLAGVADDPKAKATDIDVRWKQRAENFSKAVGLLRDALKDGPAALNVLEKEGTIQRFEYTVELAWKTLKDYLEASGLRLGSVTPKSVVKAAFSARLIPDGQIWIDMLEHRNLLSHRYDPSLIAEGLEQIEARYLPAIEELLALLRKQDP